MQWRKTFVLVVAAMLGVAARTIVSSSKPVAPNKPSQALVISPGKDSFGEVWETTEFTHTFPVENRSSEPVEVVHVSGSCNCMKIEPQAFTVAPGATQNITVTIDFTKKPSKDGRAAFGLTYFVKDEQKQMRTGGQWVVQGLVNKIVQISGKLDFGRISNKEKKRPSTFCEIKVAPQVDKVLIDYDNKDIDIQLTNLEKSRQTYRIEACLKQNVEIRHLDSIAKIKVQVGNKFYHFDLYITGSIVHDVELAHSSLIGITKVGVNISFELHFRSKTTTPYTITPILTLGCAEFLDLYEDNHVVYCKPEREGNNGIVVVYEVTQRDDIYYIYYLTNIIAINQR
jgi:hypothetical protein